MRILWISVRLGMMPRSSGSLVKMLRLDMTVALVLEKYRGERKKERVRPGRARLAQRLQLRFDEGYGLHRVAEDPFREPRLSLVSDQSRIQEVPRVEGPGHLAGFHAHGLPVPEILQIQRGRLRLLHLEPAVAW